jgi:hypothetical protein
MVKHSKNVQSSPRARDQDSHQVNTVSKILVLCILILGVSYVFLHERLETFHGFNLTLSSKIMMVTIKNTVVCDVMLIGQFTTFSEVATVCVSSIQEWNIGCNMFF